MTQQEAGELPAKTIFLRWEPTEDADQRAYAAEMVSSLFTLVAGWLEPLAIETDVGCYDREIFATGSKRVPQPYHLLIREPLPTVRVIPLYRSIEVRRDVLIPASVSSWVEELLGQSCGDKRRYETSLQRLLVQASSIQVPRMSSTAETMALKCYAGRIEVPIERRGDVGWISGPPTIAEVPQPVAISVANLDGWLRLAIKVFWSPWLADLGDAESMLQQGIARLVARGWGPSDG